MAAKKKTKGALVIAGMGLAGPLQMTLQTLEALKRCDEVLCLVKLEPPFEAFAAGAGIAARTIEWAGAKKGGVSTTRTRALIEGKLAEGKRIGVVVDGHPELFSPVRELGRSSAGAGHAVECLPALGSLEQLMIVVSRRLGPLLDAGFCVVNTHSVDWKRFKAEPSLALFVYNAGTVARGRPGQLDALAAALAGRKLYLLECLANGEENVLETAPKGLAADLLKVGVNATLCAGPVRR